MDIHQFIILLPTVIACLLGFLFKGLAPEKYHKFIPVMCATIGVAINCWINLGISPQIIAEGLVSGVAATGMFELVKQLIKG